MFTNLRNDEGNLKYLVFGKDYEDRKTNPNSLLDRVKDIYELVQV